MKLLQNVNGQLRTMQPLSGPITPDVVQKVAYPAPDNSGYTPPSIGTMPSSMDDLPPERLRWFIDEYLLPRIAEVMHEVGLQSDGHVEAGSWMHVRERNQNSYDNDLQWRKGLGGIFQTGNNFTLGDLKRYARLLSCRVRSDLLGTRPCFGALTGFYGDAEMTREAEEFIQERIDSSNVLDALRDGQRVALIRNEAIIKTTYLLQQTSFQGPSRVMVDQMGRPIQTPFKKLYIEENDDFLPSPDAQGVLFLEKDPSFQMVPGQFQYASIKDLPQTLTNYDNPHSDVLDYRDFLCPLRCRSIHDADINVHFFTENPDALRGVFQNLEPAEMYYARRAGAQSGAEQPRLMQGEPYASQSRVLGSILMADTYCRIDQGLLFKNTPNGKSIETWTVLDMPNRDALFYDYLGNHMSRRPFSVIPGIERVPNRWYGVGVFTKMEHAGLYIDTQFNRVNEKDSQNSSFNFRIPHAVKQWQNGQPVKPGSREFLDLNPGYDLKNNPAVGRINLAADAELQLECLDRMKQAADQEFAVISARDASASDLNQSKTATGIMSIDRDANVITQDVEYEHITGIESVLGLAVEHLLTNMDAMEMRFNPKTQRLVTLSREDIRSLPRKVKLLLTKTRSAQQLQSNQQAEAVWLRYMNLNPYQKFVGRGFYVKQLKALEIDDVDNLLPAVSKEDADAFLQQQAEAAKHAQQPPSKSIATKYGELERSEQVQLLQQENIQPASPEEVAAKDHQEQADKLELKRTAPPRPATSPASK